MPETVFKISQSFVLHAGGDIAMCKVVPVLKNYLPPPTCSALADATPICLYHKSFSI